MSYSITNSSLSELEYKKYARHLVLDNIGDSGQKRLKAAKILFIGAGGLAASAILYLAASGVNCLGVADDDKVDYSNLHRQILYNNKDVGKLKVGIVYDRIKMINPECNVNVYSSLVDEYNCEYIIKNYDIVIDTTDNFQSRYIISKSCYLQHKVHIYGAVRGFEGHISVFNYRSGPIYSDLYPQSLNLDVKECNMFGVLGVTTGIIGIFQAVEAMKVILGIGNILSGYLLVYNLLDASFKKFKILPKNNINVAHYHFNNQFAYCNIISEQDLSLIRSKYKIILIDVRQPEEFIKHHLLKAINIPLKNIRSRKNMYFMRDFLIDKIIIVYCYDNLRSLIASQILYKHRISHYLLNY
uniref:Probable molybdopterin-synthase adenylyltransferase n=1 Tax=Gracilaria tenuistipitata var. liui TaxID=285951 RepID=MOEB_GRATL|nr:molybdopterin biosynthesis protein [Gracilaria tenuistipitata var. liui]Q6B908.1 RecName: Full=Probable molybdopterin-synthase adenylyltransferase; AltName: Full=MoaD protein adenylase; AltName: Full=Molybdopterin-converting factor subunit 1 adenylase; AltName: Full=Sulfur carrier protein MoaD adenylyltransferase [Gracilaria tenuistipitata var. liui]AAT79627.1 molybdopterin biosynthesis protein [Gracilaria tenuistipitata var. liui]